MGESVYIGFVAHIQALEPGTSSLNFYHCFARLQTYSKRAGICLKGNWVLTIELLWGLPWKPSLCVASWLFGTGTYPPTHNDDDVTCVPISSLVVDAYNVLVQKKFYKFYVLPIGASTVK